MATTDYFWQQENHEGLPPFWPARLPPIRPHPCVPTCQTTVKNRFQPFTDDGDVDVAGDDGEQQPTELPIWSDDVEPIEYEDDDEEPEELTRQKSCEAPANRQHQEHIESNHATYR